MNVARINFSHGDKDRHRITIKNIRKASKKAGREVAILADLPGPKIRVGNVDPNPMQLNRGQELIISVDPKDKDAILCPFTPLIKNVEKGSIIFLDDGFIQVKVQEVKGKRVYTKVVVGGRLISNKGLSVPGADLDTPGFIKTITRGFVLQPKKKLMHSVFLLYETQPISNESALWRRNTSIRCLSWLRSSAKVLLKT